MATEIELKAHVRDPEKTRKDLSEFAVLTKTYEKNDIYYIHPDFINRRYGVRLRNESDILADGTRKQTNLVTYKTKEINDGIEVNDEKEFEVSSGADFGDFLCSFGFLERIKKTKKGAAYNAGGMTAELSEVDGLGWFIELEIIIDDRNERAIAEGKERILKFLDQLQIPRELIEERSYTEMLIEKGAPFNL